MRRVGWREIASLRTLDIPAQFIATYDDGHAILTFSGNVKMVPYVPWSRRVHRVSAPFLTVEDLGQVTEKFAMVGMTEAAARIIDRDFLIWEKDTLRVFQEANFKRFAQGTLDVDGR